MNPFSIEDFAAGCKQAMAASNNPEAAAKAFLEKALRDYSMEEIAEVLDGAIPAGASVGEMIVHSSPELTMLYARVPPRFESGIHNHTVFACIGQLEGTEVSTVYKQEDGLSPVETLVAVAGSVISLPADVIHHIENPGNTTGRSLHIYGGDFKALNDDRSLWDVESHDEQAFSFPELLNQSVKIMKAHGNRDGLEAVAQAIPATRSLIDA